MIVKIKLLHSDARIPEYALPGDAGMDLTTIDDGMTVNTYREYRTGIALEIPPGYVGLIFPRSSISITAHSLANSVGVIDSNYRGEIKFRFRYDQGGKLYAKGDRIGQLVIVPYPQITLVPTDQLDITGRGAGGYGSTGT